jgi:hypothetical protein
VTEVAGVDNTFVFDMNGVLMQGVWHEGSGVTTGGPNDPIVITQGGYWTLNLVGFGDMSWSQAAGGNYVEATQNWGAAVGVIDPLTHQPVYGASGGILKWPSGINVAAIYNSGLNVSASQAIAADPILFSQNGYWDFQREGGAFHPEFIDASTVAIGLYNAAAGVPLSTILTIENNYAASHSNYPAGTIMNSTYTHLPERNVQNTIIGYQLADHIRQASGT